MKKRSAALRYDQSVNSNPIINIENNGGKKVVDHGTGTVNFSKNCSENREIKFTFLIPEIYKGYSLRTV